MQKNKITTRCSECLEENTVSLEVDYFICESCGGRNSFDNEKFKDQQRAILKEVFGDKPDKPENN